MRKVKNIASKLPTEIVFKITLEDETSSTITLVKDNNEWNLQGDGSQRFSFSELVTITKKVRELNKRIKEETVDEDDDEDDDEDEKSYY